MNDTLYDIVLRLPPSPAPVASLQVLVDTVLLLVVMIGIYQLVWRGQAWFGHWQVHRIHQKLDRGVLDARMAASRAAAILQSRQGRSYLDRQRPPRRCTKRGVDEWRSLLHILNRQRFQSGDADPLETAHLLRTIPWWLYRD